jgi:ABC-2 type transport system permease protein
MSGLADIGAEGRDPGFWRRLWAMVRKEFVQMRRDRLTFAMMISIPVMQLVLFGYAINLDPRGLPTAVLLHDDGPLVRQVLRGLETTGYFALEPPLSGEEAMEEVLRAGDVQFVVEIPSGFERALRRGETAQVLVVADATDPAATGGAVAALPGLAEGVLRHDLPGGDTAAAAGGRVAFVVHRRYNPAGVTQLNIVPGLLGVILTMTMTLFTSLAVTREVERGTMESLLAMPIRPVEIMLGKILPFILVGLLQMALILGAAKALFAVPFEGSVVALVLLTVLFVVANLSVGYTFSTIARNQLQAVQMTFLFFLPSILLSGFMFPFRGMPGWAQIIGEGLPLTHFLRLVRGILLKGAAAGDLWPDIGALAVFALAAMAVALARFRQTVE